jgi:chaperonin GroES
MNIQAIGERVILEPIKKEEKTSGGIYIPEEAQKDKKEGTVLAVGNFKDGKELPLKKGDRIIYGGYSSEKIELEDKEYILVEFKDILAKIGGDTQ